MEAHSIKDETDKVTEPNLLDTGGDSVCMDESNGYNPIIDTPSQQKSALSLIKKTESDVRPQSNKQSDRYSARDFSERGNNMLCDSETSV